MVDDILATQKNNNAKLFGRKWKISVLIPLNETELSADVNKYTAYVYLS